MLAKDIFDKAQNKASVLRRTYFKCAVDIRVTRAKSLVLLIITMGCLVACGDSAKEKRMQKLLSAAESLNSRYCAMDTVAYMDEVFKYYDSYGNKEEKMRANYMMGSVFRDKGDSPMALHYFLNAANMTDTTNTNCDFEFASRIYAQMALLFEKQRYPLKELEMWRSAASLALKAKDTLMYLQCNERMGSAYLLCGDREMSLKITRDSYKAFKRIGRDDYAASLLGVTVENYLLLDSLKEAKHDIDEYIRISGLVNADGDVCKGCEGFYYLLGLYYEKVHKNDSALFYYRKLATFKEDVSNLENGYKGLMNVFLLMNATDSVAKYARLYADANDSANAQNSANEVSRVQALYDYSEHQQEALRKSEEANALWRVLCIGGVAAVIGAFAIYRYVKAQKARNMAEMKEISTKYVEALRNYQNAIKEYEQYKTDSASYEEKMLKNIESLHNAVQSYQEDFDINRLTLEQNLQHHQAVLLMHNYASQIVQPSEKEWEALASIVKKFLPTFWRNLMDKDVRLSDKELRVCILTRLNFIPYEIGVLMNLTKQRVSNMRSSLNKKLFNGIGSKSFNSNIFNL